MISWFARNSVAANLLMFGLVVGGLVALWSGIRIEVFPPEAPRTVTVSVELRGATPEDVESGIAVRIEEAIYDLEGIERIISRSREGSTSVQIDVERGFDPRVVLEDVKIRVDAINTLPVDAERPIVALDVDTFEVMSVVIAGDFTADELRIFADEVRADLLRIEGITQAELESVGRYEIAIEAAPDRLRELDISLGTLAAAVAGSSLDLSAGNIRSEGGDVLIRSKGQAYRRDDFERIVVKTNPDGTLVTVGDVARVVDGFQEGTLVTRFNGLPAAMVAVRRVGDQNAITMAAAIRDYVASRQEDLPEGMTLGYWDDDSVRMKERLGTMLKSAVQGGVLVIILLSLFLRPAVAGWVFLGIPVSFLGSFIALAWLDISLNLMSAFGFIVVLGIVVDDAIVTGENVYSHLRTGRDGLAAAVEGTREVAVPVTYGVLTTIAAFTPLGFLEGDLGEFFKPIPAVVIPVLLISLIESKLVLPAHLKNIRVGGESSGFHAWQRRFADRFERAIDSWYRPLLRWALERRYETLALFVGILLVMVVAAASGRMRWVFFPSIDSNTARATLEMPIGTPFEVTDRHVQQMVRAAQQLQRKYTDPATGTSLVTNIFSGTGSVRGASGTHLGQVQFETIPQEERTMDISTTDLNNEWRELVGPIPGAEKVSFRSTYFRPGAPIDLQFAGRSLEALELLAEEVKDRLATVPGVFDITDSLSNGKQEVRIELRPQGHLLGLTRRDLLRQIGQAFLGLEAQRVQRGRDDIRVLVRYPIDERSTYAALEQMLITTPDGRLVPLDHVAELKPGRGPSQITRVDQQRVLNVTADVDKDLVDMPALMDDLLPFVDALLVRYPGVTYSLEGEDREREKSARSLATGLAVVAGLIYCLLALPLRSYLQPLVVMSVVPFGLLGALLGHWSMGYPLSLLSLLGLVALIGVVINDSLVLVDFSTRRGERGEKIALAVENAGAMRFRPVILTSLTTFFSLMPLLLGQSRSAQFLIPMAISLGFGILAATFITLILVPTNILIADDFKRWSRSVLRI